MEDRKLENWNCHKCGIRIGAIDPDAQQLRIRYKDFVLAWEWDENAIQTQNEATEDHISILCRRCAWVNKMSRSELVNTKIKKSDSIQDK